MVENGGLSDRIGEGVLGSYKVCADCHESKNFPRALFKSDFEACSLQAVLENRYDELKRLTGDEASEEAWT